MMELKTINPKENKAIGVTDPPNQSTSPYAMSIIVRFLKMVYTGIERNFNAFVLVYIIPIRRREIGNPGYMLDLGLSRI